MLQQLMTLWEGMEARRRLVVVAATVAMFLAVLGLAAMSASQPAMSLLYAGLNGKASGDLLSALDQRGARYEIRGDAIYVPAAERDALRMALAGEGLPATGGAGYELLDNISGFGTTAQMFDAAYWRAKEGELARTIVASPMVRSARVHIAVPVNQPFRSEARPTASVAISGANGPVPPRQAQAVRHLVAAAVSGLRAEDVAVIDAETGVVIADEEAQPPGGEDRAAQLRQSVQRLLEAHVGVGRAIVEVAIDTVTEREAITEKTFDPAGRVPISSENEENSTSSNETRPAPVTVASNLPAGAASQGGTAQNNESRTRERVNYEVSQKTREVLRTPGATRRMTVAVLVDGVHSPDASQTAVFQPRPAEELASLRELVASAVGFDEARGDVITIRSLPLQPPADAGSLVEASWLAGLHVDAMQLAQILVLAIVALVLGLFVLRPALLGPAAARAEALPAPGDGPAALTGEIHDGEVPLGNMSLVSDGAGVDGLPDFGGGFAMGSFGGGEETPVDRLRRLIAERREETAEILRAWMEESDEEKVG